MQLKSTDPAQRIALLADVLRDISATGDHFAENVYDKDNYRRIQDVAVELLAIATGESLVQMEPLRATAFLHRTPFAVGDGAVIDEGGRMLLIRRADNKLWAMPGGGLEVGETAAAGVVREVYEETGIRATATGFIGVYDSRLCGTVSRHHMYHFTFLCEPVSTEPEHEPSHLNEVLDVQWRAESDLPDEIDPGHILRIRDAFTFWRERGESFFDSE